MSCLSAVQTGGAGGGINGYFPASERPCGTRAGSAVTGAVSGGYAGRPGGGRRPWGRGAGGAAGGRARCPGRQARAAFAAPLVYRAVQEGSERGRTTAFGVDPNTVYEFRYRVASLGDLVASHTDGLMPNPQFPRELQPRLRDRVGSHLQVDKIAKTLNPDALLTNVKQIDRADVVGPDNVVESGNGCVLALRRAAAIRSSSTPTAMT